MSWFRPLDKLLIFSKYKTGPRKQLPITPVQKLHYEEYFPLRTAIFSFPRVSFQYYKHIFPYNILMKFLYID